MCPSEFHATECYNPCCKKWSSTKDTLFDGLIIRPALNCVWKGSFAILNIISDFWWGKNTDYHSVSFSSFPSLSFCGGSLWHLWDNRAVLLVPPSTDFNSRYTNTHTTSFEPFNTRVTWSWRKRNQKEQLNNRIYLGTSWIYDTLMTIKHLFFLLMSIRHPAKSKDRCRHSDFTPSRSALLCLNSDLLNLLDVGCIRAWKHTNMQSGLC